jgi:hypothetical protein
VRFESREEEFSLPEEACELAMFGPFWPGCIDHWPHLCAKFVQVDFVSIKVDDRLVESAFPTVQWNLPFPL